MGMQLTYKISSMTYIHQSNVSLKVLHCALFIFFNRAHRVLRNGSTLIGTLDLRFTAIVPLLISAALHTALLCPGCVIPTRVGRVASLFSLLHVLLLHAFAIWLVILTLQRYATTASFLSVILASHLCLVVRPIQPDLVHSQNFFYGYCMRSAAYAIPVLCWVLLPVFRVHELEAIALIYVPEALCFAFQYVMQFTMLLLHVAVVSICSVGDR
jgi:hypothetical protein